MIERTYDSDGSTSNFVQFRISKTVILVATSSLATLVIVGGAMWLAAAQPWRSHPTTDPFSPSVLAAEKFPLYYPTSLPSGYHIDIKSVSTPKAGVVLIAMKNASGGIIYMSEEARVGTENIGGIYTELKKLKVTGTSDGSIATGFFGNQLMGSRANNTTWLWSNTSAPVTQGQMTTLLQSIKPAS